MEFLTLVSLGVCVWWLWEIRCAMKLRLIPPKQVRPAEAKLQAPETYLGAVPPARYEVIRWPSGQVHYNGSHPTQAKQCYEHTHPIPGEAVEIWEQGTCRGHKDG